MASLTKENTIIAVIVLLAMMVVIGGIAISGGFSDKPANKTLSTDQAQLNLQEASAKSVQATLDVYYALHGAYPVSIDELKDDIAADAKDYGGSDAGDTFASTISDLPKFDYTSRGDREAYAFTYTDAHGQSRSTKGNYKEDYH